MISYTARMAALTLREYVKPSASALGTHVLEGRAWPWLCDYQFHINNSRYLELMDYGRTQFFVSVGLVAPFLKGEIGGVAAGIQIVYRRPIDLMERYRLQTQLVGWDSRWYLHEQTFFKANGEVATRAFVRSMLRGPAGPVSIGELLAAKGLATESPAPTEALQAFMSSTSIAARTMK